MFENVLEMADINQIYVSFNRKHLNLINILHKKIYFYLSLREKKVLSK